MTKVPANTLKIGDIVMPPAREVRLWMRREVLSRELTEAALHLTITSITEGLSDKGGRWLVIRSDRSAEWNQGRCPRKFQFRVQPESLWPKIS